MLGCSPEKGLVSGWEYTHACTLSQVGGFPWLINRILAPQGAHRFVFVCAVCCRPLLWHLSGYWLTVCVLMALGSYSLFTHRGCVFVDLVASGGWIVVTGYICQWGSVLVFVMKTSVCNVRNCVFVRFQPGSLKPTRMWPRWVSLKPRCASSRRGSPCLSLESLISLPSKFCHSWKKVQEIADVSWYFCLRHPLSVLCAHRDSCCRLSSTL